MSSTLDNPSLNDSPKLKGFVIQKGMLKAFARIRLIWSSMKGVRILYLAGILALFLEALFTFASPAVIKLTLDSVLNDLPPSIPAPLDIIGKALLGPEYQGGGLIPLPPGASATGSEWVWRPFLRANTWLMGLAFVGFIGFQALFSFLAGWSANKSAETGAKQLRDRLYGHVQDLPYETLLRAQTGDWLQRCTSDVDTTRRFLSYEIYEIARTLFLVGIAFPVMLTLNLGLTAWGSIVIPVILVFSFVFHHFVHKAFMKVDEREGVLSGIIQENVTGVRVVRAFARQEFELKRFAESNNDFRDKVYKLIWWLALYWGISSFLGLLQLGIVLGAGLHFYQAGTITLGMLVLFMTYEQQVLWPIRQFGRLIADAGKAKVALGRMSELLTLEVEQELDEAAVLPEPDQSGAIAGAIEFDRVSFTYPDGTVVLHDLSFTIAQGEQLAILGPTGSGKTSLVHLLLRLYEPSSGTIRIGGRDIRTMAKRDLRKAVALVLQEGFLYGKTIKENIHMARKEASEAEIFEASRSAALHHVVEDFGQGYQTLVGERGVTLSGGQRQRLALARALVRDTPFLILDDSLSAVDTETDALVRSALKRQGMRSSIIIAHRLTTLASADRILVLEHGKIADLGTHQELIGRPGLYQRLYELQNSFEADEKGIVHV